MPPDPAPWTPQVGDRVRVRASPFPGTVRRVVPGDDPFDTLAVVHFTDAAGRLISRQVYFAYHLAPLGDADTPSIVNG